MKKKFYLFREGNGNVGNYPQAVFQARDIENANNIVRRFYMNLRDYYRRQLVLDWEENQLYYTVYGKNEDYAPYTAQIWEITEDDYNWYKNRGL